MKLITMTIVGLTYEELADYNKKYAIDRWRDKYPKDGFLTDDDLIAKFKKDNIFNLLPRTPPCVVGCIYLKILICHGDMSLYLSN